VEGSLEVNAALLQTMHLDMYPRLQQDAWDCGACVLVAVLVACVQAIPGLRYLNRLIVVCDQSLIKVSILHCTTCRSLCQLQTHCVD
jgi:hypothetical protein